MEALFNLIGYVVYTALGILALWGGFNCVLAWRRVVNVRFRDEDDQDEFLDDLDTKLNAADFDGAIALCEDDRRALPQLALFAVEMRSLDFPQLRRRLSERFQQDVLADLDHRLSWVTTVIKTAPMLGLFGTVIGMMGAFANLSEGTKVDTALMAENIMLALITTACGLAIAVPLLICSATITLRIRKMENLLSVGTAHLLDSMKPLTATPARRAAGA
ncbi:MAG: MotA/TolQ/ExbB proton channel family protein [Pirellulales bacterium]|nr:MotA/TolQ/ExbB proton channel family protein [Pirellulales bacterium]